MQRTTLSPQLTWWDVSSCRGILELEPPPGQQQLALELEVVWGDGDSQPTYGCWRLSQGGEPVLMIDGAQC